MKTFQRKMENKSDVAKMQGWIQGYKLHFEMREIILCHSTLLSVRHIHYRDILNEFIKFHEHNEHLHCILYSGIQFHIFKALAKKKKKKCTCLKKDTDLR